MCKIAERSRSYSRGSESKAKFVFANDTAVAKYRKRADV